jgi:hypothetical protein
MQNTRGRAAILRVIAATFSNLARLVAIKSFARCKRPVAAR